MWVCRALFWSSKISTTTQNRHFGSRYLEVVGVVVGHLVTPFWNHGGVVVGIILEYVWHIVFFSKTEFDVIVGSVCNILCVFYDL